jgi:hypothetical protein
LDTQPFLLSRCEKPLRLSSVVTLSPAEQLPTILEVVLGWERTWTVSVQLVVLFESAAKAGAANVTMAAVDNAAPSPTSPATRPVS